MESQLEFIDVLDDDCLLEPSQGCGEQCKKKKKHWVLNKQVCLTILQTIRDISVNTLSSTILERTRTKLQEQLVQGLKQPDFIAWFPFYKECFVLYTKTVQQVSIYNNQL